MKDYIVTEAGIWRLGEGGYRRVAEFHCGRDEARQVAQDLGVELREPAYDNYGISRRYSLPDDCADKFCDHTVRVGDHNLQDIDLTVRRQVAI